LDLYSFEPQFVRPAPPLLETKEDDVIWLNLEEEFAPLWDHSMLQEDGAQDVKELMAKAFKGPLTAEQQKV
jgi:hypothetical protein